MFMVGNDEEILSNHVEVSQAVPVWFSKALCFVRICNEIVETFGNEILPSKNI